MEEIAPSSKTIERAFWDYLDELLEFRDEYGHTQVPENSHKDLHDWISLQKTKYNNDSLPLREVMKLESVGIEFDPKSRHATSTAVKDNSYTGETFPDRIKELKELRMKRDDYDSINLKSNPSLFQWISKQKKRFREGNLTVAEERELEDAGVKLGKRSNFSTQCEDEPLTRRVLDKTDLTISLQDNDKFAARFNELKEFKELHGHCNVLKATNESLYNWVTQQRKRYLENKILRDEKTQLKEIGLTLKPEANELPTTKKKRFSFSDRIAHLVAYKEKNGHMNVNCREDFNLYQWINTKKNLMKKGSLRPEERKELYSVGFMDEFTSQTTSDVSFEEGNVDRHASGREEDNPKNGNEGESVDDDLVHQDFLDSLEKLLQLKESDGDNMDSVNSKKVFEWAQEQQRKYKDGTLSRAEENKLSSIGFDFFAKVVPNDSESEGFHESKGGNFFDNLEKFLTFKTNDGDLESTDNSNKYFNGWIGEQKMRHKKRLLSPSEVKGLKDAGIIKRRGRPSFFSGRFRELQAFVQKHGHCNVSSSEERALFKWVQNQKNKRKYGSLKKDDEEKLSSVGLFDEENTGHRVGRPSLFLERYRELQAFVQEHGHCNVSSSEECALFKWVQSQKDKRKRGLLKKDDEEKLSSVGLFDEEDTQSERVNGMERSPSTERKKRGRPSLFPERFRELQAFVQEHGHCNVSSSEKRVLYKWVQNQKDKRKYGSLKKDDEEKLSSVGLFDGEDTQSERVNDRKRSRPRPTESIPKEGIPMKRPKAEDDNVNENYEQSAEAEVSESTNINSGPTHFEESYVSQNEPTENSELPPSMGTKVDEEHTIKDPSIADIGRTEESHVSQNEPTDNSELPPSISTKVDEHTSKDPSIEDIGKPEDVPLEQNVPEGNTDRQAVQSNDLPLPRNVFNGHGQSEDAKRPYNINAPTGIYMRTNSNALIMRLNRLYNITGTTLDTNHGLLERLENIERIFFGDGTKVRGIFIHRLRMLENELLASDRGDLNFQFTVMKEDT
jgi:hypothetical protein